MEILLMKIPNKPLDSIFTHNQWQAIYQKGSNIIVSAGAGSGKTSVLTERVIQHLLQGVDVTSLLILTFTKAAAEEMKIKIRNALKKAIDKGYSELIPQLERLEIAHIQTFDSFCLNFVKKYHHIIHVSNEIVIGDSVVLSMAKEKISSAIINDYFNNNHNGMKQFLSTYEDKDSRLLSDHMIMLNQRLLTYNLDESFLDDYFNHYCTNDYYDLLKQSLIRNLIEKQQSIHGFFDYLVQQQYQTQHALNTINKWKEMLLPILQADTYEHFLEALDISYSFRYEKLIAEIDKQSIEPIKAHIRDIIDIMKKHASKSFKDHVDDIESTRPYVQTIIEMTKVFSQKYRFFQDSNAMYDFQTIAYLASSILKNHIDVATETKHSFYEILVDEYQDTSELQNQLIQSISNNNVFMVGDMKQSIYGFRDAKPDLFKKQYDLCKNEDHGVAIDLNANFRSRKELLEDINQLFSITLSESIGGVDYDDSQKLYYGNKTYDTNHVPNQTYGLDLHIFDEVHIFESYEKTQTQDFYKKLRHEEIHGIGIVEDIQGKIESNYQVYDHDLNALRNVRLDDFVILVDRKKDFQAYKKLFEYHELPLYIHSNEPFFDNDDILALRSVLILVGCFQDKELYKRSFKHAFMSAFRSFIFQIDDNILVSEMFRLDVLNVSLNDYLDTISDATLQTIFKKLEVFSNTYHLFPIDVLLQDIIDTFEVVLKATSLGNVEMVEKRLLHLINQIKALTSLHYGLNDVLNYFDFVLKSDTDIDYQAGTKLQKNMINMMTIHKSKGLEFPIVYYPMLFLKWNENKAQSLYFDLEYGIIIKGFNEGLFDTIPKYLLIERTHKDGVSEQLRLLYVALTRAKELAVLMLSKPDKDYLTLVLAQEDLVPEDLRSKYQSFQDIIYSAFANLKRNQTHKVYDESMYHTKHLQVKDKKVIEMDSIVPITYNPIHIQSKSIVKNSYSKSVPSLHTERDLYMMSLGTRIHEILEHIDYKSPILEQLDILCKNDEEKSYLNHIETFPFLTHIKHASIHKEYQFLDILDGIETLGIIDLVLEYETHIEVVDYKLSNIESLFYEKQIKGYMSYLKKLTHKPVKGYLYSIIQKRFIEFI